MQKCESIFLILFISIEVILLVANDPINVNHTYTNFANSLINLIPITLNNVI